VKEDPIAKDILVRGDAAESIAHVARRTAGAYAVPPDKMPLVDRIMLSQKVPQLQALVNFLKYVTLGNKWALKHSRDLVDPNTEFYQPDRARYYLSLFAEAKLEWDFIGTVENRGYKNHRRYVCLKDIRFNGCPLVLESHLWVKYDRHWERVEPFLQGLKVLMVGTPYSYKRQDDTEDFSINIRKLVRLW